METIAFLTMDSLEGFYAYDHLTFEPLARRGIRVEEISWRRPEVDWSSYRMVVIRSPWDYQNSPQQFLHVLSAIDQSGTRLQNSLAIVHWNIHKTYLKSLHESNISIVPTQWWSGLTMERLQDLLHDPDVSQWVVKPVIGAGAENTFRLHRKSPHNDLQKAVDVFAGRDLMVQPFVQSVVDIGEFSLFYFGGQYSHCILKTPKRNDFRVQEEHGGTLQAVPAAPDLLQLAEQTLAAAPAETLYARVDIVRMSDGRPALMELEIIEPSLYLTFDPQAAERFATAIEQRLRSV